MRTAAPNPVVTGMPRGASPAALAQAVVAVMGKLPLNRKGWLPTGDAVAVDLARICTGAARVAPRASGYRRLSSPPPTG
jgi:hypothetical protein